MERHEELLSRAKNHYCNKGLTLEEYELLEKLFPEIRKSSDEKIRKALLSMVHDTTRDEIYEYKITKEEALAWLEKQKPAATPIEGEFPYTEPSSTLDGEIKNIWNKLSFHGEFTAAESGFSEVIHHFANWLGENLIDRINKEGCAIEAKMISACLKQMNGEKVDLTTIDKHICGAKWADKHPDAIDMNYLQSWYQASIDETQEPIWTDKHLEELFDDFYLIPKNSKL